MYENYPALTGLFLTQFFQIPGVACCMGGTYIGVSTNASAFSCSRSSVDLDPDRAKRAGRRRRIR
jgi:hypothetical protein